MENLSKSHVLYALADKRARLAGEITALGDQLRKRKEQLIHLDATLRLFDETYQARTIRPIKPVQRLKLFKPCELGRHIVAALRNSPTPLRVPDIVTAIITAKGFGDDARPALFPRVRTNLDYLAKKGVVAKSGAGTYAMWGLCA